MAQRVFLSYRRSDTALQATALKLVLESHLPDVVMFVDTASISPGEVWPQRLRDALRNSLALVALIGPRWRFAPDGFDRFSNEEDWVRLELSHALDHLHGKIVPVFFEDGPGAAFDDLPADLADLPSIQAIPLTTERSLKDARDIASSLADIIGTDQVNNVVEFPTPNSLKSNTPKISQEEFEELKSRENSLNGWIFASSSISTQTHSIKGTEIRKTFSFKNFKRAFSFMAQAAILAEARPHHPDWRNVWNRVDVRLRTFDADQSVTWYDIEMASIMDGIASKIAAAERPDWPPITPQ